MIAHHDTNLTLTFDQNIFSSIDEFFNTQMIQMNEKSNEKSSENFHFLSVVVTTLSSSHFFLFSFSVVQSSSLTLKGKVQSSPNFFISVCACCARGTYRKKPTKRRVNDVLKERFWDSSTFTWTVFLHFSSGFDFYPTQRVFDVIFHIFHCKRVSTREWNSFSCVEPMLETFIIILSVDCVSSAFYMTMKLDELWKYLNWNFRTLFFTQEPGFKLKNHT